MPSMDGLQATQILRQTRPVAHYRSSVLTASVWTATANAASKPA